MLEFLLENICQHKDIMIPVFSPVPDPTFALKMQYSPILPPFTPHWKSRGASHNRGASPWKHHRREDRFPPLSKSGAAWKESRRNESYQDSMTVLSPTNTDQNKSFQSTTILRSVPIMRRHLDTFGGRTFSLPAKTKAVPFHTGRFIFDPHNKPIFFEELTQNQRLQAELAMVEKVRGLKRKRESLEFRWGWKKLDLSGFEMSRGERQNFQAEMQKLKELILPSTARDIYTGRGFRLPDNHHTKKPVKPPTSDEPPYPPPPSTTLQRPHDSALVKPSTPPVPPFQGHRKPSVSVTARSRERPIIKQIGSQPPPQNNIDLLVQSVPVPGISSTPVQRHLGDRVSGTRSKLGDAFPPSPQPTPVMKMHEPVEQIEVIEPQPVVVEDDTVEAIPKQLSPMISETPVERSRSMAAPSASPDVKGQFNPLISISAVDDSISTNEEYSDLRNAFLQLEKSNDGVISFEQVKTVLPTELNEHQQRFLESLYNVTTQNLAFGPDEFIAMTKLAHQLINQSPSTQAMYEQINFATLEESLTQYTELFSSVDRTGRGRIGVGALLQILSTTLQRQLEPDTKLALQIMETMQKEFTSDVPRLDFLAFIPYFLYLEEMT